jgi:hypothetical protein
VDREDVREDRRRREQQTQEPSPPVSSGQVLEHPTTTGTQHTPAGPTTRAVSRSEMRANSHGGVRPHRISSRVTHIEASRRARPAVHVSHGGCTDNRAAVGRLRPEMLGNRQRIVVFTAVPRKQGTLHGRQGTRPLRSLARPCSPSWPDGFHGRPAGFRAACPVGAKAGAPDERPQPVLRTPGWVKRKRQVSLEPGPTTLTNGRTRSSEYRNGINGRHRCLEGPRGR